MAGSTLKILLPGTQEDHSTLRNRNIPLQHILESVYRQADGVDLATILSQIQNGQTSVLYELVTVTADAQRVITLTTFTYNMSRDVLFVQLQGIDVYEGTDKDYVKTAGNQITFNYDLKANYEVLVVLAGTVSNTSFGDDVYNALNQFRQLVDVPKQYYGSGGKAVFVNQAETGLVFDSVRASYEYITTEVTYHLANGDSIEAWMPLINMGTIKSIKVIPTSGYDGEFYLSAWDQPNGEWIYYSGMISTILYDIMDIPFIDISGQNSMYIKLLNKGPDSDFKIKIYTLT
jgi:hypothetical protein